jgi:hypothetical protein
MSNQPAITNLPPDEQREHFGRLVRDAWVLYCLETGDTKPSHIAPWDDLSEWDKEADRRIGDAFVDIIALAVGAIAVERDRYRAALEHLNATGLGGVPVQMVVQQALNPTE